MVLLYCEKKTDKIMIVLKKILKLCYLTIYTIKIMKKITLLGLLLLVFQVNAQVLSENFDTALNWTVTKLSGTSTNAGWSRVTAGTSPGCSPFAGAGMARFNAYNIAAGNVFALTSPSFNLTGSSSYRVNFSMYRDGGYATAADKVEVYLSTSATANGTLLGTVNRSTSLSPTVSADGWYQYQFTVPAGTSGARYLRLVATSQYGNNIFVDEVSVNEILTNDLFLSSMDLQTTFIGNVAKTITGSFINNGTNTVNSAVLNWQVDSGAINSQNLTGLNLAAGATYNYTHNTTWTPTPGNYSLKVWVSLPNGVADNNLNNDELVKTIRVASNSAARKPLYEKFTSSTCGPCAGFNANAFNPFYTSGTNSSDLCLINYQMNWPGSGDPYYTAEGGTRRTLYGVSGVPDLFVNGKSSGAGTTAALQTELNAAKALPAYFSVSAVKSLSGTNMNVNVTTTPYIAGQFKLHIVVVEKLTTGNVASNGETSFKNVMMKMIPDANGTTLNAVIDTPINTNLTVDLNGTHVEEYSDLEVIVFVQDPANKEIMNATFGVDQLSANSFDKLNIGVYPNPSNGLVTVDTELPTQVKVMDVTGKIVFEKENVTNNAPLNLTDLQKGIYMLQLQNEEGGQIEKIVIK